MKTFYTIFVLLISFISVSLGQNITLRGAYEFTGNSTGDNQFNAATVFSSCGIFTNFTRTGVKWVAGANEFRSSNWGTSTTRDANKYVTFSYQLTCGLDFDICWPYVIFNVAPVDPNCYPTKGDVMYRYGSDPFALAATFDIPANLGVYSCWLPATTTGPPPPNQNFLEVRIHCYNAADSNCVVAFDLFQIWTDEPCTPVELTSFTAKIRNNNVVLNWQTATEVDNHGFEIERSSSVKGWQKIGFINGSGNSNSPKVYSYTDNTAANDKYIYRLKQIDANGKYSYSKEVEVDMGTPSTYSLDQNYPNPFNPTTVISYQVPIQSTVQIDVFNSVGEIVRTLVNEVKEAGYYDVEFNAASLSSGVYFYRITAGDFIAVKKLMIMK
jgi:hypothetical protein